jgi:hypothetical protein
MPAMKRTMAAATHHACQTGHVSCTSADVCAHWLGAADRLLTAGNAIDAADLPKLLHPTN